MAYKRKAVSRAYRRPVYRRRAPVRRAYKPRYKAAYRPRRRITKRRIRY